MRLCEIAKGTMAVRAIPLALVNAAQPGQASTAEPVRTIWVGVRVLTGDETFDVLEKAQVAAAKAGVIAWDADNSICKLQEMVHTIAMAVVSVSQKDDHEPQTDSNGDLVRFFSSVEEIRQSTLIGADNIVYLHEKQVQWQDTLSPLRMQKVTFDQATAAIIADLDAKEGEESPLVAMSHATLVSLVRILGKQLMNLLEDKLRSSELESSGTGVTSRTPQSAASNSQENQTTKSES